MQRTERTFSRADRRGQQTGRERLYITRAYGARSPNRTFSQPMKLQNQEHDRPLGVIRQLIGMSEQEVQIGVYFLCSIKKLSFLPRNIDKSWRQEHLLFVWNSYRQETLCPAGSPCVYWNFDWLKSVALKFSTSSQRKSLLTLILKLLFTTSEDNLLCSKRPTSHALWGTPTNWDATEEYLCSLDVTKLAKGELEAIEKCRTMSSNLCLLRRRKTSR